MWKHYISENYSKVEHLPFKERLKELSKMKKSDDEQGGKFAKYKMLLLFKGSGTVLRDALVMGFEVISVDDDPKIMQISKNLL